ncbi:MAG: hypothetical protein AB1896_10765 [Thermodesulfobacteriota bacterium]
MRRMIWACVAAAAMILPAAGVLAQDDIPNYLQDVKEGEWVLYDTETGRQQKSTVIKVEGEEAVFLDETIENGQTTRKGETRLKLSEAMAELNPPGSPKPKVYRETAKIKDREVPCEVVELELSGRHIKLYLSNEVPVLGIIKLEAVAEDGRSKPILTLVDYGN